MSTDPKPDTAATRNPLAAPWRPHHFMRAFDSFGRVMGLCRRCGKSKEARRHV